MAADDKWDKYQPADEKRREGGSIPQGRRVKKDKLNPPEPEPEEP